MTTTICYNLPPVYHLALRNVRRNTMTSHGEILDSCACLALARMDEDPNWMLTNKRDESIYAREGEPAPREWTQTSSRVSATTRDCIREFSDRTLIPERFVPRVLIDLFSSHLIAAHSGPPAPLVARRQTSIYIADALLKELARMAADRSIGVGAVIETELAHLLKKAETK
jgi:hypothetical protein